MKINKNMGYLLAIGLLTVALIGSLTAWAIEYHRNSSDSPVATPDCGDLVDGCQDGKGEPDDTEGDGKAEPDPDQVEGDPDLRAFHPIATIDDQAITLKDWYLYARQYYGSSILNQMLDEKVLDIEAQELGIVVNTMEVERELKRMQQGYDSEEEFYHTMKTQLGMDRQDIERDIRHTLLMEKVATADIVISDEELQEHIADRPYEVMIGTQLHIQQIIVTEQDEAELVISQLDRGVRFEDLAAAYSDDSMFPNGDLGWIDWDDPFLPVGIMEQARKMKVDEISPILTLDDGTFALIKLQGKKS
jgi:foldase protein PrsA